METFFQHLRRLTLARDIEFCKNNIGGPITLDFHGNKLGEETGEVQQVINLISRLDYGLPCKVRDREELHRRLVEELADVIMCVELIAAVKGIDLEAALVAKFNETSDKYNLPVRM